MILKTRLILPLCLIWVAACTAPSSDLNSPDVLKASDKDITIRMQQSTCFGNCPSYIVKMSGDGTVQFCGLYSTLVKGPKAKQIDPEPIHDLLDNIIAQGFFEFEDIYKGRIPDSQGATVSVTHGGDTKTVINASGGTRDMPDAVKTIANDIRRVADIEAWIGPRESRPSRNQIERPDCGFE